MESLDRHASSVSPATQAVVGPGASTSPTSSKGKASGSPKRMRHASRDMAGRILGSRWRVCNCGRKTIGGRATLHDSDGTAHFGGVETCGSIWVCPVCAAKITEGRRAEIDRVLAAHREAGGRAYMATLTLPHYAFQRCDTLRRAVSGAWRKVKSGKAWVEARERYGWIGDIRALEITHGHNGWHPHLHVLIMFEPWAEKPDFFGFARWLFDRWAGAIERMNLGRCSEAAFAFEPVEMDRGAADYVSKWGAALELTKAHTKRSKNGRTPFQILADFNGNGSDNDARLFREYAAAFKGARHLTWSRDLRRRYAMPEEQTDEELSNVDAARETHRASIDRDVFRAIVDKRLTADVLTAFEAGGVDAVTSTLTQHRIPWRLTTAPGLTRCWVPLITGPDPRAASGAPPGPPPGATPRPGCRRNPYVRPISHLGGKL